MNLNNMGRLFSVHIYINSSPPFCLRKPGTGGAVRAKLVKTLSNTICVSSPVTSILS